MQFIVKSVNVQCEFLQQYSVIQFKHKEVNHWIQPGWSFDRWVQRTEDRLLIYGYWPEQAWSLQEVLVCFFLEEKKTKLISINTERLWNIQRGRKYIREVIYQWSSKRNESFLSILFTTKSPAYRTYKRLNKYLLKGFLLWLSIKHLLCYINTMLECGQMRISDGKDSTYSTWRQPRKISLGLQLLPGRFMFVHDTFPFFHNAGALRSGLSTQPQGGTVFWE